MCYTCGQVLGQDFKTASPTQRRFQNDPSNPVLENSIHAAREFGSDPVLHEKKEYNTMEAPLIGDDHHYDHTLPVKLQEYTHFGNNMKIFY